MLNFLEVNKVGSLQIVVTLLLLASAQSQAGGIVEPSAALLNLEKQDTFQNELYELSKSNRSELSEFVAKFGKHDLLTPEQEVALGQKVARYLKMRETISLHAMDLTEFRKFLSSINLTHSEVNRRIRNATKELQIPAADKAPSKSEQVQLKKKSQNKKKSSITREEKLAILDAYQAELIERHRYSPSIKWFHELLLVAEKVEGQSSPRRYFSGSKLMKFSKLPPDLFHRRLHSAQSELAEILSLQDELSVDKQILNGKKAMDMMIHSNIRLVINIAKKYDLVTTMKLIDRIQEGIIGLKRAVEKFDVTMGFRFSTYATHWIKQSIQRALTRYSRDIRLPTHIVETLIAITHFTREYKTTYDSFPEIHEISEGTGRTQDQIRKALDAKHSVDSLNRRVKRENGTPSNELIDYLPDRKSELNYNEMADAASIVYGYLGRINERQRLVLSLRYGLIEHLGRPAGTEWTLAEIGKVMYRTPERIRLIEAEAFAKIQRYIKAEEQEDGE